MFSDMLKLVLSTANPAHQLWRVFESGLHKSIVTQVDYRTRPLRSRIPRQHAAARECPACGARAADESTSPHRVPRCLRRAMIPICIIRRHTGGHRVGSRWHPHATPYWCRGLRMVQPAANPFIAKKTGRGDRVQHRPKPISPARSPTFVRPRKTCALAEILLIDVRH